MMKRCRLKTSLNTGSLTKQNHIQQNHKKSHSKSKEADHRRENHIRFHNGDIHKFMTARTGQTANLHGSGRLIRLINSICLIHVSDSKEFFLQILWKHRKNKTLHTFIV